MKKIKLLKLAILMLTFLFIDHEAKAQLKSSDYKPVVDSSYLTDTVKSSEEITINYSHPEKIYPNGDRFYLGHDTYLLKNNLIVESTRIDPVTKESTSYFFDRDSGLLFYITFCYDALSCMTIYYNQEGKINGLYQVNEDGLQDGWAVKFNELGVPIKKEFIIND